MLTIAGRPSLVQDLASATVGLLLFGLVILGAISLIKLVGRRLQGGTTAEAAPPVEDAVLPPGEDGALAEVRRSATVLEEELEYGAGTVA